MAKKGNRHHIILESTESGHSYHSTKNKQNTPDRIEVTKYDPVLRKHVSYVSQNSTLVDGSINFNMRLLNKNETRENIINACKLAKIHDTIMSFPGQYEYIIGENGSKLSGGQRQRLTIARSLLNDPEILILDEATNQLDKETEISINQTLLSLRGLKTIIIISHKIETIVMADKKSCIKFKDCNTRDEANVLQGLMIYLPRNAFNFIATNEHYLIDIMESKVVNEDQKHIGMVIDVLSIFSQNIIEVKIGENEVLIPYVDDYITLFDNENRKLIVKNIMKKVNVILLFLLKFLILQNTKE